MTLRRTVLLLLLLSLVSTGCRGSSERRLVSIREGELTAGYLTGDLLYVETRGVRLSAIFIHDLWENSRQRVPLPEGYADSPSWSPDGTRFAFALTGEDGASHIWVVNDDGSSPQQITRGDVVDNYPRWSPDGRQLVFSSIRDGEFNWRLFRVGVDGGEPEAIGPQQGHNIFPDWLPDGRFIVFSHRAEDTYDLRLLDLEDGSDRELFSGEAAAAQDMYTRAAPDGKSILFATNRDDATWQIWVFDLVTNERLRIIGSDSMDEYPVYSPDQEFIAFSTGHLAIYRADGQEFPDSQLRWAVTQNLAWSPDWRESR